MAQSASESVTELHLNPVQRREEKCSKRILDADYKSSNPKRLKTLAFNVKHSKRNNLLHQLVQDNSYPNKSVSENCINGILRAMCGDSVNALNDDGYSALHLAVLANNIVMVKKLIFCLRNIDVNQKCDVFPCNTALHFAVTLGYLSIIKILLDKGADPNIHNLNKETAVGFAVESSALDILELLVSKGADVNMKSDDFGRPPIFAAVKLSNLSIVKFLMNNGADVNACDYNITLLHYAVKLGNLEIIQYLVANGAYLNAEDNRGETVWIF